MEKTRILMIVGSLRRESFQRQLAQAAQELLGSRAEVAFLPFEEVPFFNQDLEFPAPQAVVQAREAVSRADGVWFFVPEYNHGMPGVLKNLLDWLSRPNEPGGSTCMAGKPATFSAAGGSSGAACAMDSLLTVLAILGMEVMAMPRTGIALSGEEFQTNRLDLQEAQRQRLGQQADAFLEFIAK